jgi:hypothetical protein
MWRLVKVLLKQQPLTLAYDEYAMKKSSVLDGIAGSRYGQTICEMAQEVGSQNSKKQMRR